MSSDPSERRRRRAGQPLWANTAVGALASAPFLVIWPSVVGQFGAATIQGLTPRQFFSSPTQVILVVAAFLGVLVMNAVFVASEASLTRIKPPMLSAYKSDDKSFVRLEHLLKMRESYLAGAFMGSQTMRAWLFLLCLLPAYAITDAGDGSASTVNLGLVIFTMILLSIPVAGINILVAELIPRSYAAAYPVASALRLFPFLRFAAFVFWIPTRLATSLTGVVTKKIGADAAFSPSDALEEEIKSIIEDAGDKGQIEQEEVKMLDSVFDFGDTIAREVMTPRVDMDAVSVEITVREAAKIIEETGHSRLPVYQGTDDQILGIVHAKDIMRAVLGGGAEKSLRQIGFRQAVVVPENRRLHDLLNDMRTSKVQLVIVQDEFGGTAGIVTIEDIVEEVMGEIVDEYDNEEPPVVPVEDGYLVDARLHLDDVNKAIGTSLFDDEFDTLGGYVFGLFGRQPAAGETVSGHGCEFQVVDTNGKRILKVRVSLLASPEEGGLVEAL